jgi:hypothetical protein
MNEPQKKRIEKFLSPETDKSGKDLHATSGFVEVGNFPLDRLKRGLRSVFGGMPDIVLSHQKPDEEK